MKVCGVNMYEQWWDINLDGDEYIHNNKKHKSPSCSEFEEWMGDKFSEDRVFVRRLLPNYESILDAGCGAAPEYFALSEPDRSKYIGLDITKKLVQYNLSRGISCVEGSINKIPFDDKTFDVVISRHVTEHMSSIEKPLSEIIRVCRNTFVISFFISPNNNDNHVIKLDNPSTNGEIYHNCYSRKIINNFLSDKVQSFEWLIGVGKSTDFLLVKV